MLLCALVEGIFHVGLPSSKSPSAQGWLNWDDRGENPIQLHFQVSSFSQYRAPIASKNRLPNRRDARLFSNHKIESIDVSCTSGHDVLQVKFHFLDPHQ